ncbi:hypothetical protein Csa_006126 [Cucumis sativus]|uniref:Uncharacterized protein n=1 Tax=Cucumis sativus TaxID=3659 RepID=A0A0A0LIM4_CUCSA|nr:hypothetical protein Csa_006126 [Cucumis sativus]
MKTFKAEFGAWLGRMCGSVREKARRRLLRSEKNARTEYRSTRNSAAGASRTKTNLSRSDLAERLADETETLRLGYGRRDGE